ncbi:uncharacterized protein LOC101679005 isoform X8 [Mustela putorius furo]|uniref:Uncharacterized protein LOC101679005 isoform X8 n=1 Tax=Mustela putorius furo TaxID=9669 RepID=A0A8U0V5Q8_MUSPF|nr:uncharacterized protein LOC101679005 isoform X8 [Mustela putorius furo]
MGEGPLALSQSSASSTDRECVTRKTRNLYSQERQAERILQVSPLTVLSGDYGSLGTLHAQVTPTSKDRALSPIWLSRESAY